VQIFSAFKMSSKSLAGIYLHNQEHKQLWKICP